MSDMGLCPTTDSRSIKDQCFWENQAKIDSAVPADKGWHPYRESTNALAFRVHEEIVCLSATHFHHFQGSHCACPSPQHHAKGFRFDHEFKCCYARLSRDALCHIRPLRYQLLIDMLPVEVLLLIVLATRAHTLPQTCKRQTHLDDRDRDSLTDHL
jgi:hypothetical protein